MVLGLAGMAAMALLSWSGGAPARKPAVFAFGDFRLNYTSENPLPAQGDAILRDEGRVCNVSVERRALQGGGALFESFARQYASAQGAEGGNWTDFTAGGAAYKVLFCDGAAFITRIAGSCSAGPSCLG